MTEEADHDEDLEFVVTYCESSYQTSFGVVHVEDERRFYDEAERFCREKCAILAPINTRDRIDEISHLLFNCQDRRTQGHVSRLYRKWFVGLRFQNGTGGRWSDGNPYIATEHESLFDKSYRPHIGQDEQAVLWPYSFKLFVRPPELLEREEKFLCWVDPADIDNNGTCTMTSLSNMTTNQLSSSSVTGSLSGHNSFYNFWFYYLFSFFGFIILLLLASVVCFWWRKRRKRMTELSNNDNFDNLELDCKIK